MKKQISTILFLAITLIANATIRTVSNSPNNFAQYNSIQAAVNASSSGDTIYVHASDIDYGNTTVNKKVSIFGGGWSPQTNPTAKSICGQIYLESNLCNGLIISGMTMYGNIYFANGLDDIQIIRNKFVSGTGVVFGIADDGNLYQSNNILIEGNYFENNAFILFYQAQCNNNGRCPKLINSLIINNVFLATNAIRDASNNNNNVIFSHNLFYGSGSIFSGGSKNFIFQNNILVNCNPTSINTEWQNNISYNCSGTNTPWIGGTNSGTGNIENTNPNMMDQTEVDANIANPLLNFTIPSGPANDAGTDGKDLGLMYDLTGFLNWANSRNPKLPVVNNLLINSTASPGGNLEIHLNATHAK